MVKLVLVQPRVGFQGASYWEPLGLGFIAAWVLKHVPDIKIEVFSQAFDSDEEIVGGCQDADYVGFGCTTPQLKNGIDLSRQIKQLNQGAYTVFGGYHPSVAPFDTKRSEYVDKVIVGEGENGMLATLRGNKMDVYISEPIMDLDTIPFPDRELIKAERHVEIAQKETGERMTSVQGSRGCPFRCLPCSNFRVHGDTIRVRKPVKIIEEMKLIKEQLSLDFIKFCDATFNTSVGRVLDFCKEAKAQGLDVDWGCNIHPAMGTKEMFERMREARCREVWIGAESGSPAILRELRKGVTVERIEEVFKITKEADLLRRAYFLIGSKSETMDDIKLTEQLAERIDADTYGFTVLCPFPGTDPYDDNVENYKNVDWSLADEYSNSFYRNISFTNEQLKKIRQSLADRFRDRLCWRLQKHEN
jgi:anaerobic magnesium-protoporphyrin IX monomethyl ester cyclase